MTYTDDEGETALLGILSGPGDYEKMCIGAPPAAVYGRVANARVLRWIKKNINDHN